jgi:hypothetical protein
METSTESQTKQAEKGATRRNALLPGLVDHPEARRERRCSLAVSSLAARLGVAGGEFDNIHARIKLLRNAIEQREGPADHQQICG